MFPIREWQKIPLEERKIVKEYLQEVPVRLGAMAKMLGVMVKTSSKLPNTVSGQIQKTEQGSYEIKINKFEFFQRQRFTLAHELAHFLLHKYLMASGSAIKDNVLYRSGAPETVEYEANRLAAELIVPEAALRQKYRELEKQFSDKGSLTERLADAFQVSKSAMEIRLETIF